MKIRRKRKEEKVKCVKNVVKIKQGILYRKEGKKVTKRNLRR
jgi:hypothetical protein